MELNEEIRRNRSRMESHKILRTGKNWNAGRKGGGMREGKKRRNEGEKEKKEEGRKEGNENEEERKDGRKEGKKGVKKEDLNEVYLETKQKEKWRPDT